MPQPDVLDALLDCYLDIRAKSRKSVSIVDSVSAGTTYLGQKFFGQPDDNQIIKLINDVKKQFRPKDRQRQSEGVKNISFDEWIDAVYYLGEKSFEIQSKKISMFKSLTENESLLCLTFHALRNYIVTKLIKDSSELFNRKITSLLESFNTYEERAAKSAYQNLDVTLSVEESHKTLLHLALLEHKMSIYHANQRGLFNSLYHLNNKPANSPRCLQEDFCKVLYEERFQSHLNISFEEFESQTIKRSLIRANGSSSSNLEQNEPIYSSSISHS